MSARDPNPKSSTTVATYPTGEAQVTSGSATVLPGDSRTFLITVYPASNRLGLWNRLWNIYVDVDDPAYDYFGGASLSNAQRAKLIVMPDDNWAQSSDRQNIRLLAIKTVNLDYREIEGLASISAGSTTLTTSANAFLPSDTGKTVVVPGAGAGGVDLAATITYVSFTQVTLSVAASTAVSGGTIRIGNLRTLYMKFKAYTEAGIANA